MKTEETFLEWLYAIGTVFYHGTDRYSQFEGYHVFGWESDFGDEDRRKLFLDLEGGDIEALHAGSTIRFFISNNDLIVSSHNDPTIAMTELMNMVRQYYYNLP